MFLVLLNSMVWLNHYILCAFPFWKKGTCIFSLDLKRLRNHKTTTTTTMKIYVRPTIYFSLSHVFASALQDWFTNLLRYNFFYKSSQHIYPNHRCFKHKRMSISIAYTFAMLYQTKPYLLGCLLFWHHSSGHRPLNWRSTTSKRKITSSSHPRLRDMKWVSS